MKPEGAEASARDVEEEAKVARAIGRGTAFALHACLEHDRSIVVGSDIFRCYREVMLKWMIWQQVSSKSRLSVDNLAMLDHDVANTTPLDHVA